ncbi:unnamed protein product [Soboliphyme baturini]|uniref:DBC1 domain-containing protein n=1 Tax=Soboliphyme baturini TaxID=241478 RepID=A0A183IXW9_9BILA|nr:unnamed protein product [Soboliphyme baturini]
MAQYGGKGGSWGRGPGGQQMNPYGGQMGGMNAYAASQVAAMSLGGGGMGSLGSGVMPSVNSAAFSAPSMGNAVGYGGSAGSRSQPGGGTKISNRAYVGLVTKMADNYGFVDDEVFFQTNVVRGAMPEVGDRVMVEANYNPNMAFKWSAIRIQLLTGHDRPAMPPVFLLQRFFIFALYQGRGGGRDQRWPDRRDQGMPLRRDAAPMARRDRSPRRSSPPRHTPRRSPPIRRPSPSLRPATNVVGGMKRERSATRKEVSVMTLRKRYNKLYIPSDFFHANYTWMSSFPLEAPFSIDHSAAYHVMHKDVDCFYENNAVLDPPDVDYRYSAKVMLLDLPPYAEMFKRTLGLLEDGTCRTDYDFEPICPNRLIGFLVGLKGKSEVLAIGGPWSASLDGPDPENDPRVLIKTAIRTCKAMTGVDLSKCTQW